MGAGYRTGGQFSFWLHCEFIHSFRTAALSYFAVLSQPKTKLANILRRQMHLKKTQLQCTQNAAPAQKLESGLGLGRDRCLSMAKLACSNVS